MMQNQGTDTMLRKIFVSLMIHQVNFHSLELQEERMKLSTHIWLSLAVWTVKDIEPFCKNNATLWGDGWLARMAIVSSEDVLKEECQIS